MRSSHSSSVEKSPDSHTDTLAELYLAESIGFHRLRHFNDDTNTAGAERGVGQGETLMPIETGNRRKTASRIYRSELFLESVRTAHASFRCRSFSLPSLLFKASRYTRTDNNGSRSGETNAKRGLRNRNVSPTWNTRQTRERTRGKTIDLRSIGIPFDRYPRKFPWLVDDRSDRELMTGRTRCLVRMKIVQIHAIAVENQVLVNECRVWCRMLKNLIVVEIRSNTMVLVHPRW